MTQALLNPAFLFRFAAPCLQADKLWTSAGAPLTAKHGIPCFAELQGARPFADLLMAWNAEGLALWLEVRGKTQPPWCRPTRVEDSDGLQIWIDTRDTHNVHRAGRYCHRFIFMPSGAGRGLNEPAAQMLAINRCREMPKPVEPHMLRAYSEKRPTGYTLHALLPAAALTGWDAVEHTRLGFTYAVIDRELGTQTFSLGPEFPFDEDPSLWGTLELKSS
jgi:hypothetical protein